MCAAACTFLRAITFKISWILLLVRPLRFDPGSFHRSASNLAWLAGLGAHSATIHELDSSCCLTEVTDIPELLFKATLLSCGSKQLTYGQLTNNKAATSNGTPSGPDRADCLKRTNSPQAQQTAGYIKSEPSIHHKPAHCS
jgi:hypothetical protein